MPRDLVPLHEGKHRTDHHPEFENDAVKEGSEADQQIVCAFFRVITE